MDITRYKVLLLDGATGSELERRGVRIDLPLWSAAALLTGEGRNVLKNIHADYIRAGADVITANTFRTNIRTLKKTGLESQTKTMTRTAIDAVRRAIDESRPGHAVYIAGSVAPVEDCYVPDRVPPNAELISEHHRHIDYLYEAGADIILIETMNTLREAVIALEYARQTGLPVFAGFVCGDEESLLSGEPLTEAVREAEARGADVIMVNCATVDILAGNLRMMRTIYDGRNGAYANILSNQKNKNTGFDFSLPPEAYAETVQKWIEDYRLFVVGGCCGTTPDHIEAIRRCMRV